MSFDLYFFQNTVTVGVEQKFIQISFGAFVFSSVYNYNNCLEFEENIIHTNNYFCVLGFIAAVFPHLFGVR